MHPSSKYPRIFAYVAVLCAVALLTTACGKKEKTATQVVAAVDGEEISVHQINAVLAKARGITPENLPQAKADILGGLVDQQLAINLAMSKKLDRTPEVVAAIEAARREILARAALEQIASAQPKPTDDEAKAYYAEHPALFGERRIYNLQEIAIGKNVEGIDLIRAHASSVKSMEEMVAWLKERKVEFAVNGGTRPAEQLPLEVLPKLHAFKDGQIGLVESKEGYLVVKVVASRAQPVTEVQALPTIKVFLSNQRGAEAVKLAKVDMKTKAKIEYFGEFAGGEGAYKAKAEADAKAATEAAAQAKAKAKADADTLASQKAQERAVSQAEQEARAKARAEARTQSGKGQEVFTPDAVNLEKGIKGLK
ncbi:MAG: EpsD family peptidyl-prolyl cis-trans isomerase [Burkholderiales bacterium]|nr:EpsD family peptidyl-prolyl cis-trans isomerase [Burkholderiales bacterium]